jgi:hypothetical protein
MGSTPDKYASLSLEASSMHYALLFVCELYPDPMAPNACSCFKLKYGKESLMASNAPAFCQIWFVWRGRHIWTREASAATDNATPVQYQYDVMTTKRIRFSSYTDNTGAILDEGYPAHEALTTVDLNQGVVSDCGQSNDYEAFGEHEVNHLRGMSISDWQDDTEPELNSTFWSRSSIHADTLQLDPKVVPLLYLYAYMHR